MAVRSGIQEGKRWCTSTDSERGGCKVLGPWETRRRDRLHIGAEFCGHHVAALGEQGDDEDGEETFRGVEDEGVPEKSWAQRAAEIGGADVFGAGGADINAVKFADDQPEGDGGEKDSRRGGEDVDD